MKFSKLVEHVSKKPIPPHTKHLLVEVMLMDEEMEDVEVCHDNYIFECSFTDEYFAGAFHTDKDLKASEEVPCTT
jgi:hypothetical protein